MSILLWILAIITTIWLSCSIFCWRVYVGNHNAVIPDVAFTWFDWYALGLLIIGGPLAVPGAFVSQDIRKQSWWPINSEKFKSEHKLLEILES